MKLLSVLLLLFIISCQNTPTPIKDTPVQKLATEEQAFSSKEDSIKQEKRKAYAEKKKRASELNKKGRVELSNAQIPQKNTPKFPACAYSKVFIYALNGHGNSSRAESAFKQRNGDFKEVNPAEVKEFLKLLNSKKSYGNTTAACHEPRIGLVFFDKDEAPCSYLSLCLACNNIYTRPELELGLQPGMESGFSLESRKKLHKIFKEWGFPDEEYSPLFDDDEMYAAFLRKKGYTEEELKGEIKNSKEEFID